jgi:hypothetical protein
MDIDDDEISLYSHPSDYELNEYFNNRIKLKESVKITSDLKLIESKIKQLKNELSELFKVKTIVIIKYKISIS